MIWWLFITYAVIGAISLIVLIIMLVLGGLGSVDVDIDVPGIEVEGPNFDIGDGGAPGPVSVPVILSFMSAFGILGAIMTFFEVHPAITPFLSAAASLILAGVLFLLTLYLFKRAQADSTISIPKLVGMEASVNVSIRGGKEGQVVLVTEQRGRTILPAVADRDIEENTRVRITGVVGDAVKVMPISDRRNKVKGKK
ncbi:MAG: NfeD family protein [Candidatus Thermoplasmatota archaeon]|nr:NfeD family protein [Candidatus Thermoplasmatota archaeon]